MLLGFANGDFWKLQDSSANRFNEDFLKFLFKSKTNAIELHCINQESIEYLAENEIPILKKFRYISMHSLVFDYDDSKYTHYILQETQNICKKHNVSNVVFHADSIKNWNVLEKYHQNIPISIENMDNEKTFGKTLEDMSKILDNFPFNLTLDLQHCYVNDNSMKLAHQFQEKFKDRIVEYHISGYNKKENHYPLFKTNQKIITESLLYKEKPIIIESVFNDFHEASQEIEYLNKHIFKSYSQTL